MASGVQVRNDFPDIFASLLPAIDTIYLQDFDEPKVDWEQLFTMKKSTRQFENNTGFTGFPTVGTVGEGEDYPLYSVAQLYDKKFTHTKFGGAWAVTEEMEDDDQYELVASMARKFKRSFRFTREVNFSNVFNNANSATELSADGSNVLATHTLYNASTKSNLAATDFGVASAQTMFDHFASLTDDQGIRIGLRPWAIVANPAMRWVIGEVMRSSLKPYTTDNEKNILNEMDLKEIYWPEITDTDAWYVVVKPSTMDGNGLRAYNRQPFTTSTDFQISNTTMLSVGRGRWSRGVIDWRAMYGSPGA